MKLVSIFHSECSLFSRFSAKLQKKECPHNTAGTLYYMLILILI